MSRQSFNETYQSITSDPAAVGNTVTETILVPDFVLPANFFIQGTTLRITMGGRISNVVTATPTITIRVHVGPATLSPTAIFTSGALLTRNTVTTNESWRGEGTIVCRSTGAAGTIMCMCELDIPALTGGSPTNVITTIIPQTAPATQPIDTTVANIVGLSAQWSAAAAGNTIQIHRYHLEAMN